MNETVKKTTMDIGDVDNATELVFMTPSGVPQLGADDRRYILQAPDSSEDYLETLKRYMKYQIKRTTNSYIDDTSGKWFACYNVDCFDPPMAIVRARTFEDAYTVFCCEFEHWIKVEEPDAADYPEDERDYNDNGTHIDASNVQINELVLVSVHCGDSNV